MTTARDGRASVALKPGHAEAAFLLELHAVALDEFRIDERDQIRRIAPERDVGDEDPQRHADLRGRQTDARRRVHRLDHVVDELQDVGGDLGDGARRLVQHIGTVAKDRTNHGRQAVVRDVKRRRTCSAVAS